MLSISDVKTQKRRMVVGIDMIRNNRITVKHALKQIIVYIGRPHSSH